jgi:hypothetical protein
MCSCENCKWWDHKNVREVNINNNLLDLPKVAICTDPDGGPVLIRGDMRHNCARFDPLNPSR